MPRKPDPAFAAVLDKLMTSRAMINADLARELDVSPTQVSRWRRGLEVPSINRIDAIAKFFGVDRDTLERLSGWRDNPMSGAQETINPEMAAMLDAERAATLDDLSGIPSVFHTTIMATLRSARRIAVDNVKAVLELTQGQGTISQPETSGLASQVEQPPQSRKGKRKGSTGGPDRPLSRFYALVGAH